VQTLYLFRKIYLEVFKKKEIETMHIYSASMDVHFGKIEDSKSI
jgi:hypothetical protein